MLAFKRPCPHPPHAQRTAPLGGATIFRNLALPPRLDGRPGHCLHRQTRSVFDASSRFVALAYKGFVSGADGAVSFRCAWPPGWSSRISCFFRSIYGLSPANSQQGAPNPSLYSALLAAIHLLLFATLVRLYSARTNRDYAFLAVLAFASILASAILTVDTGFLISLAVFLVLAVSTFVALEIRRSAAGSRLASARAGHTARAASETRARTHVAPRRSRHARRRRRHFFSDSPFHHRLPERHQSSAHA